MFTNSLEYGKIIYGKLQKGSLEMKTDTVVTSESLELPIENNTDNVTPAPETIEMPKTKKRRRRLGDRGDGRRVRGVSPMTRVACYIMEDRTGASNRIRDCIEVTALEKYVREKRTEGMKSFTMMHAIIAAYVRVLSQMPALNRFIAGHKIFSRNKIEVALTIKKEMNLESPDTVVKIFPEYGMTAKDVYELMQKEIDDYRNSPGGAFDDTAKVLNYFPGFLMLWAIRLLRGLDYIGLLPKFLTKLSPFHCSMFITSMGSLGIPPIYHHLYDFGNCPVFIAFGAKERKYEVNAKGEVEKKEYVGYTVMMDERICDGFYFAAALKKLRRLLRDPWQLDVPPEDIIEDID